MRRLPTQGSPPTVRIEGGRRAIHRRNAILELRLGHLSELSGRSTLCINRAELLNHSVIEGPRLRLVEGGQNQLSIAVDRRTGRATKSRLLQPNSRRDTKVYVLGNPM